MKSLLVIITLLIVFTLNAETLFEVKDAQDSTVFSISDDGMRVFNNGDTLMVISSSEIKAFIANSKDKALSRSFSVSTSTTGKGQNKIFEVATDEGSIFYNPTDNSDQILSINKNSIIANVNPALDRDFIVNDQATGKGGGNLMKISNEDAFTTVDDSTMLWYKQKNAFRVGHVLIVDDSEVGQASFGAGRRTIASGDFSTAMGYSTTASGAASTAIGYGTTASGLISTAMGDGTYATGYASTAMGYATDAIGDFSTAMGEDVMATGNHSTAMGYYNEAAGNYSIATGLNTVASGLISTAMGYNTIAYPFCSFVIGKYNTISGDQTSWISTDPIFTIGNGIDWGNPSNAFEVKKNGNTFVGGDLSVTGYSTLNGRVGIGIAPSSSYGLKCQIITGGSTSYGVYGLAIGGTSQNIGIYGEATGTGATNWAGYFVGDVHVSGTISKSASKTKVDHPLDPTNKFLSHSSVESDKMMNIYNGNAILDSEGKAVVTLPDWFEAFNKDVKYQLTAIGAPGPNLYIAKEINNMTFEIAGGIPNMKVSWLITGSRNDNFAKVNPIEVETIKDIIEKGYYLHPEVYDQSEEMGIEYQHEKRMEER